MDKRNYLIDLLRFLAAGWVALMHFNQPVPALNNWYRNFVGLGYLGVPVFFVISGYCVYLAAEHSKTAKDFMIRRFFRIFPPYWFSILIVGTAVIISIIMLGNNNVAVLPKTVAGIFETLTLLVVPFTNVQVINWVYWTLIFEIFFYLIIWISILLPGVLKSIWLILVSILPLVLPVHEHWLFFFIKHWPEFCLGLIAYRLLHHTRKEILQNVVLLALTLTGLWTVTLLRFIPVTSVIIVMLIGLNHFLPLRKNYVSKLGDYSYSIYLIHVPVGVFILGAVKQTKYVQSHPFINLGWDLILLAIIVALSGLMYRFVELPAIKFAKNITQKSNAINPN